MTILMCGQHCVRTIHRMCFIMIHEVAALQSIFISLTGSTGEKWQALFVKKLAPNLPKVFQHVLSVPISNANVEWVFSVMGNVWTDERNRLCAPAVRSELTIFFTLTYSCTDFKNVAAMNKPLLKAIQSDTPGQVQDICLLATRYSRTAIQTFYELITKPIQYSLYRHY